MALPTVKSPPKADVSKKFILLYGRSKIGKSTWASKIPGAIFIVTDPGLDEIDAYRVPAEGVVKTWDELLGYVGEIAKSGKFKVIVIDTIDMAWQLCHDAVCKKAGVEYQTDGSLAYGKGGNQIKSEFRRLVLGIKSLNLGLVFISHAEEREDDVAGGGTRSKWYPSLPKKVGEEISSLVDAIFFVDYDAATEQRVIRTKGSSRYQAGGRGDAYLPDKWPLADCDGLMAAYAESLKKNAANGKTAPVTERK